MEKFYKGIGTVPCGYQNVLWPRKAQEVGVKDCKGWLDRVAPAVAGAFPLGRDWIYLVVELGAFGG